jgi:serine-type D-Ala-D-Ala carboxypeptidase/endopeptidase (penicillin-binding protein 4)
VKGLALANRAVRSRAQATTVATVAMINLFTLGAGAAVAAMLPGRLAQWNIPRVAAHRIAAARPVLPSVTSAAPLPSPGGLARALSHGLSSTALGGHRGAVVTDLATGRVLYASAAGTGLQPASTAKLTTAVAALRVLGPTARLRTRAVLGAAPGSVVLVGGGDPTLAAGTPPATDYPQPATLRSLAAATARALRARGQRSARLGYDTSLFTGPPMAPGWPQAYVRTGNVTPISALEVDQGRLTRSGAPEDADDPGNFRPRSTDPAGQAAATFAAFLRAEGIRLDGQPAAGRAPAHPVSLAAVSSPPVSAMVSQMLRESNNVIAEDLARQVALRQGRLGSFRGAADAVTAVLRGLGVTGAIHLVDGSGLSPQDRIAPETLARVIRLAASAGHPGLRAAITGMPVAGFSGTLAPGGSIFGAVTGAGLGLVQAKTGNLDTVATLAGLAYDASGRLLAFAFMADRVPAAQLGQAGLAIDAMASALAGCGCTGR